MLHSIIIVQYCCTLYMQLYSFIVNIHKTNKQSLISTPLCQNSSIVSTIFSHRHSPNLEKSGIKKVSKFPAFMKL